MMHGKRVLRTVTRSTMPDVERVMRSVAYSRAPPNSCKPLATRSLFSSDGHAGPSIERARRLSVAAWIDAVNASSIITRARLGTVGLRNIPNRASGSTGSPAALTSQIPGFRYGRATDNPGVIRRDRVRTGWWVSLVSTAI